MLLTSAEESVACHRKTLFRVSQIIIQYISLCVHTDLLRFVMLSCGYITVTGEFIWSDLDFTISSFLIFHQSDHGLQSLNHCKRLITHRGRDKTAVIFQTTFSNAFCWMKIYEFRLRFHWSLFLMTQLTIFQHCSENGLTEVRRQAIVWTNDG